MANFERIGLAGEKQKPKSVNSPLIIWLRRMFDFDPINLCSFKYRDRVTIFRDVMKTIKRSERGGTKYSIMKHASLSYDQLNKYLLFLTNMGYIREMHAPYGKKYGVTDKGSTFLKGIEDLRLHIQAK